MPDLLAVMPDLLYSHARLALQSCPTCFTVMPDLLAVMPDLIGHLTSLYPQGVRHVANHSTNANN